MSLRNVLAVGARPLDVEIHAAATLAYLVREGATATIVLCPEAYPGGGDSERRREETRRGAEVAGIKEVVFLDTPGPGVGAQAELCRELVRWIRRARPELVLCPDPTTHWIEMDDHTRLVESDSRTTGHAVLDAVHPRAGSRASYEDLGREGLKAWTVPEVWLFGSERPNHFVDISEVLDVKHAVLACHESENPLRLIEEADAEADAWLQAQGFKAEAFRLLRLI
jgi:LmbE family N-acetylglucosaminyl deacetylase